jgi:CheY-like chemotaxis protein
VLVVDDDAGSLDVVKRALEEHEAEVTTASSAAEALSAFERSRPDALLCDISMPEQSGIELIRRVRSLREDLGGDVPAAALTALVGPEDVQRALASGYQAHIAKPVQLDALATAVARLVHDASRPGGRLTPSIATRGRRSPRS